MDYLYEKLKRYAEKDIYPFHMPGHKRRAASFGDPFQIDITEIDGFDNLHHAENLLLEAQKRAADLYGADASFYLVNGSTAGILTAVSACTSQGGKILMARNCHKAVYHCALLRELEVFYLWPEKEESFQMNGGIDPSEVETILSQHVDIQAVVITSPTYDGVVSDVKSIVEIVHRAGKILIVDEAHGAHFGFHPDFPQSSVNLGADLVIHSLHKTLPAFTQTALLHVNKRSGLVQKVEQYLGIYQTSSPSYVLMAGIDECVRTMNDKGAELLEGLSQNIKWFREKAGKFSRIKLADSDQTGKNHIYALDRSKLLFMDTGHHLTGSGLLECLLADYGIQLEMAAGRYALALSSVGDSREGFGRLYEALFQIDQRLPQRPTEKGFQFLKEVSDSAASQVVMKISEANLKPGRRMILSESHGKVSKEFVYLYPPGIPLIVPGEKISGDFLKNVLQYREKGYSLQGMKDYTMQRIEVLEG